MLLGSETFKRWSGYEPFGFQSTLLKRIIIPIHHISGAFQDHSMQATPIWNSPALSFTCTKLQSSGWRIPTGTMRWTGCLINWGIVKLKLIIGSSPICRYHFRVNRKSKVKDLQVWRLFERRIKKTGTRSKFNKLQRATWKKLIEWVGEWRGHGHEGQQCKIQEYTTSGEGGGKQGRCPGGCADQWIYTHICIVKVVYLFSVQGQMLGQMFLLFCYSLSSQDVLPWEHEFRQTCEMKAFFHPGHEIKPSEVLPLWSAKPLFIYNLKISHRADITGYVEVVAISNNHELCRGPNRLGIHSVWCLSHAILTTSYQPKGT